jgi:putative membrane-bound dehydrogenase-like protein
MRFTLLHIVAITCGGLMLSRPAVAGSAAGETPQVADPTLQVECFASAPQIVHPIGVAFDARGRLLVIESHTHFRPKDYQGPAHDRIRVLEDTDGDGKADRFTTFYEGTVATMAIAAHPDGSIYLATRNELLRLRDTKGTGKADECRRIAFLDTKGDYPHNGLSGLAFDSQGNLYFGMGENLGANYKLIGADGITLTGGGEGGNIYWCTANGEKLRRVATGFWNPFGICRDIYGRIFVVDNDPDSMPPCRMLQVVEGGDYGYQFRYGRSGRHPFQAWDGQLPGTLPMVCGVGEAPCQVLCYDSDGLPAKYRDKLLVASWADHRVECYSLKERGASVAAERLPFVQGGKDFRPVGMTMAYDGSLYITDWVRRDYNLHGQGAIWHVRIRNEDPKARVRLAPGVDPRDSLKSPHGPLRDDSARRLAGDAEGRTFLRKQLAGNDIKVRAACLTALIDAADLKLDLAAFAQQESVVPLRAMAVRALVARGQDATPFVADAQPPAVRFEAIRSLKGKNARLRLLDLLTDRDPFLRHAGVQQLSRVPELLASVDPGKVPDAPERVGLLLAWRASGKADGVRRLPDFLADLDPEVRFMAAKWVADEKLTQYRADVARAMENPKLDVRLYLAYATALARIDGQEVNEAALADYFAKRLADDTAPAALRVQLLRQIPSTHSRLTMNLLGKLLTVNDDALKLEVVRAFIEHPNPKRTEPLLAVLGNAKLNRDIRSFAVLGLLDRVDAQVLRTHVKDDQRLTELVESDLPKRVPTKSRPDAGDTAAWLKRLDGPSDAAAGRRVFFHPRLAGCYRCHRVEGRGADVGPDLSTIGRTERRSILESILQPSAQIAPHYQAWVLEMRDGRVLTGMLLRTVLDEYTYLDAQGEQFKVNTRDIAETRPAAKSIMPEGLVDQLTDQEVRDLLAYLCSRR